MGRTAALYTLPLTDKLTMHQHHRCHSWKNAALAFPILKLISFPARPPALMQLPVWMYLSTTSGLILTSLAVALYTLQVYALYANPRGHVWVYGRLFPEFTTCNGARHGYSLSPFLFSFFNDILIESLQFLLWITTLQTPFKHHVW